MSDACRRVWEDNERLRAENERLMAERDELGLRAMSGDGREEELRGDLERLRAEIEISNDYSRIALKFAKGRIRELHAEIERLKAKHDERYCEVLRLQGRNSDAAAFLDAMADRITLWRHHPYVPETMDESAADCRALAAKLRGKPREPPPPPDERGTSKVGWRWRAS